MADAEATGDEPEREDIDDALTGASDLLAAAALLERVNAADAVADLYRVLRAVIELLRGQAMLLRRQPGMAALVADTLGGVADEFERVLPPTPVKDELSPE